MKTNSEEMKKQQFEGTGLSEGRRWRCIKKCAFIDKEEISPYMSFDTEHVLFRSEYFKETEFGENFHDCVLPLCLVESNKEYFEEIYD